jgi:regulator of protease activity HflC (stomatin/prohibitin superfamily)
MADIARYPLVRHLRGSGTTHVEQIRNGKTIRAGVGASFWFRPLSAVLNEVPVDDRELPLMFHARTSDFQDVTVQATITYRVTNPTTAAGRIDFSIDPDTGRWRSTPLDQVAGLLTESAQQYAIDLLASANLTTAMAGGVGPIRSVIAGGLANDERLSETGIAVVGVRVVAVRPEPEVEKALRTPTREQVQQEADKATFERRAVAVERERAIGENELQTQIELARREEQLVAQRGANTRREAEENAAAGAVATEAEARRTVTLAEARAEGTRLAGAAQGDAEAARVGAYRDVAENVLLALAVKELAANLPKIETLVLSPDLISKALAQLGTGKVTA